MRNKTLEFSWYLVWFTGKVRSTGFASMAFLYIDSCLYNLFTRATRAPELLCLLHRWALLKAHLRNKLIVYP